MVDSDHSIEKTIWRCRAGFPRSVTAGDPSEEVEDARWLRTYVGYDYLYLQHVIRPSTITGSSSVNTQVTVNGSTQSINVTQPVVHFRDQDTWVQGINVGVELRY